MIPNIICILYHLRGIYDLKEFLDHIVFSRILNPLFKTNIIEITWMLIASSVIHITSRKIVLLFYLVSQWLLMQLFLANAFALC